MGVFKTLTTGYERWGVCLGTGTDRESGD